MTPPNTDRDLPTDLVAILILTLLSIGAATIPVVNSSPVRIVLGILFVFFIPGYVLTAVLFPRTSESIDTVSEGFLAPVDRTFTKLERVALSIGLSISVVALLALAVDISPWPLSLNPLLFVLGGFTIFGTVVATRRRWRLPPENRFRLEFRFGWGSIIGRMAGNRSDRILNMFLILSILLASTSLVYAATTPRDDEKYTRFYLLSENSNGELVADNYPNGQKANETGDIVVGIENSEHERLNYSVVVLLQPVNDGSASATISSERELDRFSTVLSHDEAEQRRIAVPSTDRNGTYRMVFLLYNGDVPDEPNTDNAYRYTHLIIDTTGSDSSEGPPDE